MKKILCIILCFQIGMIYSQEENRDQIINEANQLIATGNKVLVKDGNFPKAEGEYRKAIAKNPVNATAKYNLANAYYNSEKYDEATHRYTEAAKAASARSEKHKAFHNQGNTYMEQKKYKEAVEAYKNALRNNPKDNETRYNLALAKKMLEQQQQQNDQNKDKDQDQDKDKKEDNKDKKEGDDKEDKKGDDGDKEKEKGEDQKDKEGDKGEDKKDEGDKEKDDKGEPKDEKKDKGKDQKDEEGKPKDQQQQQQQVQGKLSPEQVKSLLEAMNNQEKKVQDKINAKKAQGSKVKTDKDW
ncbi:tetratricopeptide repeat protein [Aquimarina sp. MAR_2010_214]|uniref:tetratricopeptide repeat protein n=1 Tax=Aquimarina sp. MAR_2010_214 TaxID=1250026 RepID=UPI000C702CAF|nr:tetratricopeptide repeat protein [Aquimarina sp. MAR_2010_214]PKV48918.1 tetratricopeptide repeat protein [Aquimarina sp. MAR_2010_214]